MNKKKTQNGFDVLGKKFDQKLDKFSSLQQVFNDYVSNMPNKNFTHRFHSGNMITIFCHCIEYAIDEPTRRDNQILAMSKFMDDFVSSLKKRYKSYTKMSLALKEDKTLRGYNLTKISLNNRWEMVYKRTYEIVDEK